MLALLDRAARSALRLRGVRPRTVATSQGPVAALELDAPERRGGRFVLIHGLGTSAAGYAAVIRRLAPHASRIVAVDLPGHGESGNLEGPLTIDRLGDGLREALAVLVDEPAVFLGTSLGGAAALHVALEQPDWVASLVLASPGGAPLDDDEIARLRARFDLRDRADTRRFLRALFHQPPLLSRLFEPGLLAQLTTQEVRSFLEHLSPDAFFDADALGALTAPTTVLWGKSDEILPRSSLDFFRGALPPHARFVEVEGVGHSPHVEDPALVTDTLLTAWQLQA